MIDMIDCSDDGTLIRLFKEDDYEIPVVETNVFSKLVNAYLEHGCAPIGRGTSNWFEAPHSVAREHLMKKVYELI